ncbi:zinc finger, CCHC-type containing protein [Tanacetum coccineum]
MNIKKDHLNSPRTSPNFDSTYCDDCVTNGGLGQRFVHASLLIGMERGFLSSKRSVEGRGVKEKNGVTPSVKDGTGSVTESDGIAAATKVVSPYVVDETMNKEKQSYLVDITGLGSYSPLHTQETTTGGNTPSKSSYANVTGKPSETKVNFHTLFTPRSNGIDVVVLVDYIRAISKRFANTAYGFFLGKRVAYLLLLTISMDDLDAMLENGLWFIRNNLLVLKKWHPNENLLKEYVSIVPIWVKLHGVPITAFSEDGLSGRSSYARAMIELHAGVELKDNIVAAMPKITREGYYTCNIRVECEWKPPRNPSTTPIIDKIDKIEILIINGKVTLVDDEGKPLEKVDYSGYYDSEDKVTSVDNEMASFLAKKDGYGTYELSVPDRVEFRGSEYEYAVLNEVNTAYRGVFFGLDTAYVDRQDTPYWELRMRVSCEVQALICRIFFSGYGVFSKNKQSSNIIV